MLKYVYVSPTAFLVVLIGRGVARVAVGAMGAIITLAVGVLVLGVPFDPLRDRLAAPGGRDASSAWSPSSRSGSSWPPSASRPARRPGQYPEAVAGALFLVSGAVFPLAVLPLRGPGRRPADAADLVARGLAPGALPGRSHVDRRRGLGLARA